MAKKKKRKLKKKTKVMIFIVFLIIGIGGFFAYKKYFCETTTIKEAKVVSKIPKYGYTLKSNKSEAYKKMFQELKTILTADKVDEEKYVKKITEMFIVDFYSLDNHIAKTDVGGVDFVASSALDNFVLNAEDTFYKYVESDIYKQRNQELPVVDKVTINSVTKTQFDYGDKVDEEAYEVEATWTYKDSSIAKDYQTKGEFIFVHDGEKLVLVELDDDSEDDD